MVLLVSSVFPNLGLRAMFFVLKDVAGRFPLVEYGLDSAVHAHWHKDVVWRLL